MSVCGIFTDGESMENLRIARQENTDSCGPNAALLFKAPLLAGHLEPSSRRVLAPSPKGTGQLLHFPMKSSVRTRANDGSSLQDAI